MVKTDSIACSAPGSLMLLGEHAVLHGRRALVCAIDQRMRVELTPLAEPILQIDSALGFYESSLDELVDHSDFRFVLDAVRSHSPRKGFRLTIESEFSSDIGFGSSAAVTVATHGVLFKWLEADREPLAHLKEIFKRSLATVHAVQGRGSGSDLAASVYGGVVAYRPEPLELTPLDVHFPLTAVYSGAKMKTVDVIRYLEERRSMNAEYFERIFDRMDLSVGEVLDDFAALGRMLTLNQKLMEELGLCNAPLTDIISRFRDVGAPAKISGSGLGDCAIGLGTFGQIGDYATYALQVTPVGLTLEM